MRVLMISLDKTLLDADYSGDVLERHKKYSQHVDALDIIVLSKKGFEECPVCAGRKISERLKIYPTNSSSKLFYVKDAYRIAKGLIEHSDILVVAQDPFLTGLAGLRLKKKFKVPLLLHFHGDFWQNKYWLKERRLVNRLLLLLSKTLVKKADGIRVTSSGIRDKLIQSGLAEDKIRVIPTPVNVEKFANYEQNKVKKLRKQHQDRKTIINVGRRDGAKDYATLFKAIGLVYEKYRNLAFCQMGAGFYLPEKIQTDENLILASTDKIKQSELINYYHASDVYVSSSCHESFGKVLVEAMASGLPVVATATTGSQEIITNEVNGFLVPVRDEKALAKKILYLLNEPEKANEMGEAGRKMVMKRFDQQKIIKKIIQFWHDILG